MDVELVTQEARDVDGVEYARLALYGWSEAFDADDNQPPAPLLALCAFFEVELEGTDPTDARAIWDRLRPILERRANRPIRQEPSPHEREAIDAARRKVKAARVPPIVIRSEEGDGGKWVGCHTDAEGFTYQLCEALGTRSLSVPHLLVRQLQELAEGRSEEECAQIINTALAVLASYEPKNEGQAMLAVQMVAVHLATMRAGAASMRYSGGYIAEKEAKLLFRGARAFAEQTDVMARLQGRTNRQRIDVHYYDNRQSVEGGVHVYGRGGTDFGDQPHAPRDAAPRNAAAEYSSRRTLRGQDPARRALPRPESEGPPPVPLAWVWAWFRRPEGRGQR